MFLEQAHPAFLTTWLFLLRPRPPFVPFFIVLVLFMPQLELRYNPTEKKRYNPTEHPYSRLVMILICLQLQRTFLNVETFYNIVINKLKYVLNFYIFYNYSFWRMKMNIFPSFFRSFLKHFPQYLKKIVCFL